MAMPRSWVAAGIVAAAASVGLLYRFPPEANGFYPVCPIHQFTGLLCPGCGATRAFSALLRGDMRQAIHLNGLFVVVLLLAVVYAGVAWRKNAWPRVPGSAVGVLYVAAAVFAVVRNLL
jgi:hypothetical protein